MRNIDLNVVPHPGQIGPKEEHPHTLLQIRSADDVLLENVRVNWQTRACDWQRALSAEDVTGLTITDNCRLPDPKDTTSGVPSPSPARRLPTDR